MFESKLWLRFQERRLPVGEADTTKSLAPASAPSGAYKVSNVLPPSKGSWAKLCKTLKMVVAPPLLEFSSLSKLRPGPVGRELNSEFSNCRGSFQVHQPGANSEHSETGGGQLNVQSFQSLHSFVSDRWAGSETLNTLKLAFPTSFSEFSEFRSRSLSRNCKHGGAHCIFHVFRVPIPATGVAPGVPTLKR